VISSQAVQFTVNVDTVCVDELGNNKEWAKVPSSFISLKVFEPTIIFDPEVAPPLLNHKL
jgi:hypothetical protein